MKFGKFIQGIASEWATPHYINYKALKKIIGSVEDEAAVAQDDPTNAHPGFTSLAAGMPPHMDASTNSTESNQSHTDLQAQKTAFFYRLERELEKVNTFYIQKEAEFKVRLRSLLDKKRILSNAPTKAARFSRSSLHQAFMQFQNDLAKLQKFVEVNATGFRKILKKWDKRAKSATKELYLSRQIEIQPCFNNDVLADLTDIAATNIVELEKQIEGMELDGQETDSSFIESRIVKGNSTLDEADIELSKYLFEKNHVQIIEFLQRQRPSALTAEDPQFFSRLFLRFCAESSFECLHVLLKTGQININSVDDVNDHSCLHETAIAGRLDILKLAIEYGAIVDISNVYGRKPLHYAAMYGHADCASHLLTLGTAIDALDHDGNSALVYAIIGGHTRCVEIFLENNAMIDPSSPTAPIPISLACKYGHTDIATLLLKKGAQLLQDTDGMDPLHMACREGHAEITQLLISHGANIESPDPFNNWTPVFFAASEGHFKCIQALLAVGCRIDIKDDSGWLPWTYTLYRGHIQVASLLAVTDTKVAPAATVSSKVSDTTTAINSIKPMAPSGLFMDEAPSGIIQDLDMNLDEIPLLSLPPPIIPFRIYGHNYLEQKMNLQIHFGSFHANTQKSPIRLFGLSQLSSLKLVITSKPDDGVPYSVILPLKDELEVFTFNINNDEDFSIQFDIYPTFGTKVIGRAVVLRSQLTQAVKRSWNGAGESEGMICPLFDNRLHVVGEIAFEFSIVKPFVHPRLRIGGKVDTYWKSTKVVSNPKSSTDTVHSFVTATSLAEEYIQLVVQTTRDGIAVVCPDWFLPVSTVNISLAQLTFEQAKSQWLALRVQSKQKQGTLAAELQDSPNLAYLSQSHKLSSADLAKAIYDSFYSLEQVLDLLPLSVGVQISLKYPTAHQYTKLNLSDLPDINTYTDIILQTVYNTSNLPRSIIFSSFNPSVCTAISWKQPNYGVFFGTHCGFSGVEEEAGEDKRCTSIKEAIKFAKASNSLGLICQATPFIQMPVLINTVKESGLILATFGEVNNQIEVSKIQESYGVDALITGRVFKYNI
ncbi:phosphate system positive regulatory protein pho81 [Batrachochytrium dendrobatidis]|nr:phosphate system positive regulatory protein pho81 [Batrachochytrium dendrobatidis]KAK5670690.1 phosphate system positive regulatory protein pho81 [Batrachochytrium dendrobatidis]